MKRRLCVLSLATQMLVGTANAAPENITATEIALLPPYCKDAQTFPGFQGLSSPASIHWTAIMGRGFKAIHHYCWALISSRRAQRANVPPQVRTYLLTTAISDSVYVIENSDQDMVLLPEIFTRIGDFNAQLNNLAAAGKAYERARELKADYWPAYSKWAAILERQGKREEARALIEAALQAAPGVKSLEDQYRRLGGNPTEVPSKRSGN